MKLLLPICWMIGHDRPEAEDKPGWFVSDCQRCGRTFNKAYWWQKVPWIVAHHLVKIANMLISEREDQTWGFYGYARINNVEYIAKTHVESLLKQYEEDGLPEPLLSHLISQEGWVTIGEDNAEEVLAMLNKDFEAESNKQERKRTMKMMSGELPMEEDL